MGSYSPPSAAELLKRMQWLEYRVKTLENAVEALEVLLPDSK